MRIPIGLVRTIIGGKGDTMSIQLIEILKEFVFPNRARLAVPTLDGTLRPNSAIDQLSVLAESFQEPDDLAMDMEGNLYVSTKNRVLRLSGDRFKEMNVIIENEELSGGLNFHPDGRLMVCVKGIGLALINKDGETTWIKEVSGQPIQCPNSAVVGPDGNIYITDGTTCQNSWGWVQDLMEKQSAGRLLRYSPNTKKCEVLISNLRYPNGIEISHDQQWLLLSESWNHTVSRYPVTDIRPQTRDTVISNLPGYPGRIVSSNDGGYWMCIFAMRTALLEFVLTETKFRKEMMRTMEPCHWVAPALFSGEDHLEPLQGGGIKQLGIIKPWAPPRSYGLVIKMDEEFQIVESLHSRADGKRHGITGLCEHDGDLYIVSKGHGLILKTKEIVRLQ